MQWYEEEVSALEKKLRASPPPECCTAFYGSSSIRLWDDLAADLHDERAVNVGFGGSTLAACVYFFQRLVQPLDPASLVVYAGDNDLGDGRTPEEVCKSFRAMSAQVKRSLGDIPFTFISIKISPARFSLRDRIIAANACIREEIGKNPHAKFIDVSQAMLDEEGIPRPEFFSPDGLHLSRAGYRLWAQLLQPYRNQIFTPLLPHNGTKSANLEP